MRKPSIHLDTTNDTALIFVPLADGSQVQVSGLKLGETAQLKVDQVDQHARKLAKQTLKAAIDQL